MITALDLERTQGRTTNEEEAYGNGRRVCRKARREGESKDTKQHRRIPWHEKKFRKGQNTEKGMRKPPLVRKKQENGVIVYNRWTKSSTNPALAGLRDPDLG